MKRFIAASVGVVFLTAVFAAPSVSLQAAAAEKTVHGTVSAVAADSITIKEKETEVKLVVDSKTQVIGTGVGTKTEKMKADKKTPQIIDFVKAGDMVTAKYDDATKHASEVRLSKPTAK
jgi:hypothetical protein